MATWRERLVTRAATRKAVILARGLGSRMRSADASAGLSDAQARAADQGLKGMIPIDRPFLDYVISGLADAGLSEVCLVIGPEHGAVRDYYEALRPTRVSIAYATQPEPRGTADAVLAAREFAGNDTFLVLNADNYYPVQDCQAIAAVGAAAMMGYTPQGLVRHSNIPAERIRAFALVTVDARGYLVDIVEKPDAQTYHALVASARVSMNLWSFTPTIFEACARVSPSPRGELELQAAVRLAVHELHESFTVLASDRGVFDLSSRADVPAVARALAGTRVTL